MYLCRMPGPRAQEHATLYFLFFFLPLLAIFVVCPAFFSPRGFQGACFSKTIAPALWRGQKLELRGCCTRKGATEALPPVSPFWWMCGLSAAPSLSFSLSLALVWSTAILHAALVCSYGPVRFGCSRSCRALCGPFGALCIATPTNTTQRNATQHRLFPESRSRGGRAW